MQRRWAVLLYQCLMNDSYAVTRGGTFGDGFGLTPDGEGVLRVEADWIVDGIRVLAVAFKGIAGSLPGPKTVGVAMVDGNSRWSRIRFNKTGRLQGTLQPSRQYVHRDRCAVNQTCTLNLYLCSHILTQA